MRRTWDDVLTDLGELSPYFRLERCLTSDAALTRELSTPTDSLVRQMEIRLGVAEPRVAVSTLFFSFAARLWSVALGTELLTGKSVALGPDQLWWRDSGQGLELILPEPVEGSTAVHEVVDLQLVALVESWSRWVAPGALWGNAVSSLRGAGRVLGKDADPLVVSALNHPLLADRLAPDGRRRSCCLFYRTPRGSYCGDCCLTTPEGDNS